MKKSPDMKNEAFNMERKAWSSGALLVAACQLFIVDGLTSKP
jgi:hypothetical protein